MALGSSPLLKARFVDVVTTSRLAINYLVAAWIEFLATYWTIALDRLPPTIFRANVLSGNWRRVRKDLLELRRDESQLVLKVRGDLQHADKNLQQWILMRICIIRGLVSLHR